MDPPGPDAPPGHGSPPGRTTRSPAATDRGRVRGPLATVAALAWALLALDVLTGMDHTTSGGPLAVASAVVGWLVMVTAMAGPMLGPALQHVRARTLARDRTRTLTAFLAGYGIAWAVAGAVLLGALAAVRPQLDHPEFALAALTVLWLAAPVRQRCLNRRHRHPPLPAFGPGVGPAAARFGLVHGAWCVGTCWAPMLLCVVLPPAVGLLVMAVSAAWLGLETLDPPRAPSWGVRVPRAVRRSTVILRQRRPRESR